MEKKSKIPFPQADDFNKIINILNISNIENITNKEKIKIIIGDVTDRQVQYYLSACIFLGILDDKKQMTKLGIYLRKLSMIDQEIELARIIISKDVFGYVYFLEKRINTKLFRSEVIDIMKKYALFNSEEVYKRRAQTIIKWIEWINNVFSSD